METAPSFVNRNPDNIMLEIKMQMESMLGRMIQPAQFEQLILQIICYREVLLLERFNAGMSKLLYQFSHAPILDYIAALVAVERLPASKAGCLIEFTLVPGHGNVVIPGGTRVASHDGQAIFETADDMVIAAATNTVEVIATAQVAGKIANGYEVGQVNRILDPYAYVSGASNTTVTGGGADAETDESLRERIRLAPSQYSTAGSRASYIFHAKSANPAIIDVSVNSLIPGTVYVVPLLFEGGYEQVIEDIYKTCSAENVRPLTDTVIVSKPKFIHYEIDVEITALTTANLSSVQNGVKKALQEYAMAKSQKLGLDIVRSHISQVCRIEGVYDVRVVNPSFADGNVIVEFDEVPVCDSIKITIIGTNNG